MEEKIVTSVIVTKFPEHCKEEKPKEPCVCKALFCVCQQKKKKKEDEEVTAEEEQEASVYLKGVKSMYQQDYTPEGSPEDQSILPTDPCPKPNTPLTRIWNPYLVPKDAFRPHQPRPLGCPLTMESVMVPVDYKRKKQMELPSFCYIEDQLHFPDSLQDSISMTNLKPQKIAICRKRPAAAIRLF